jgi:hypothetical protein
MPFPNSPNMRFTLLKVEKEREKFRVTSHREVIGITRSLTREEWKSSIETKIQIDLKVSLNAFIYQEEKFVKLDSSFYKVERTFISGQSIELYLGLTSLKEGDFIWPLT